MSSTKGQRNIRIPWIGKQKFKAAHTIHIVHAHIGNCVMKSPDLAAYGDVHPRFGFTDGENDVEDVVQSKLSLLEIKILIL